ncbi:MAG: tetratricopeptide repeat protein [Deltaproteobacteria bacterium]|nr:MAG: tetratricopeptide repeat protein [Deltaproteobacteria bacterium]
MGQKKVKEAQREYQEAKKIAPRSPAGYYRLGIAYRVMGQNNPALNEFEDALKLNPHLIDALSQVVSIHVAGRDLKKAITRSEEQLKRSPNNPFIYNLLGNLHLADQKVDLAEGSYKKAISINPDFVSPYMAQGGCMQPQNARIRPWQSFRKL